MDKMKKEKKQIILLSDKEKEGEKDNEKDASNNKGTILKWVKPQTKYKILFNVLQEQIPIFVNALLKKELEMLLILLKVL